MDRLQTGAINRQEDNTFTAVIVGTATDPGTGFVNASGGVQIAGNGVKFTKRYNSGTQSITIGGNLTLAHSLGVKPELISLFLRTVTGAQGWTAGDDVMLDVRHDTGGDSGLAISPNATDIFVKYSNNLLTSTNKSTGANFSIGATSATQWSLIVCAWAT